MSVRGTGSATVHAAVYNNSNPAAANGSTVLAVHGITETGFTYEPLAQTLFADAQLKKRVRRVIALDFIGHGESSTPTGLPSGTKFGDLIIEDNVSTLIQAIDALRARGLAPRVVIGHSLGGLAIQAAQETLLAAGSSLAAHGVVGAVLLAPVPPANAIYHLPPTADLSSFVQNDAVLGSYLSLPAPVWQVAGGFTTFAGTLVPNAPSVQVITDNEYSGIEPLMTLLQLVGQIPLPRPSVRQGAFATRNGTLLVLVSFSQDVLVLADDLDDLYIHLLGRSGFLYRPIVRADAVHSMHISNPAGMLDALRDVL